jgi:L-iditol 2-dehydrogenase
MKAAVLTGKRRIETRDVSDPEIRAEDEVLVRVGATGLCGSDIHYYTDGRIGDQVVQFPFTLGHECAGVVAKTGSDVSRLKPGDRVAVDPAVVCGRCDQCLKGRPNTCRRLMFLGTPGQRPGCLSELIVVPEHNCHLLEKTITMEEGVLVEPLSIALHSLKLLDGPVPEKIAVLGAGPIGLSVLLAARSAGAARVYVTDKIAPRLDAAWKAGAAWTGNPGKSDIVGAILSREPDGLDAVFECCGDPAAVDQAVDLLKPGGRLMIIGIPADERVSFDIHRLRRKEIAVHNVRRQRYCFPEAVELIKSNRVDVRFMATHRFRLVDAPQAFELAAGYADGVIKAVILNT